MTISLENHTLINSSMTPVFVVSPVTSRCNAGGNCKTPIVQPSFFISEINFESVMFLATPGRWGVLPDSRVYILNSFEVKEQIQSFGSPTNTSPFMLLTAF